MQNYRTMKPSNPPHEEALFALALLASEHHEAQSMNVLEVAAIERGQLAPAQSRSGRNNQVVCSRRARRAHSVRLEPAFSSEMEVSFMGGSYISHRRSAKSDELIS